MEKFFYYKFNTYKKHTEAVFDYVCGDCSNIIEGNVMKIASQLEIPVLMIGLSPEQTNRYFFEIPKDHVGKSWISDMYNDKIFEGEDLSVLWDPETNSEKNLRVFFPFHVWDYDVNTITHKLADNNLLSEENSHPLNTECKILQTMRYIDKKNLGYDPRIGPFSDLVRFGKASRDEFIHRFYNVDLDEKSIEYVKERLKMDLDKLIC